MSFHSGDIAVRFRNRADLMTHPAFSRRTCDALGNPIVKTATGKWIGPKQDHLIKLWEMLPDNMDVDFDGDLPRNLA